MGISLPLGFPPGLFGGGLPTVITDDFSADSGKWLDGDLAAAAITISSGRGIWTPTLGSEEILNGGMETGDPPDNWASANDATLASVADERTGGAGAAALSVARGGVSNVPNAQQAVTLDVGTWYFRSGWRRNVDASYVRWGIYDAAKPGYIENDDIAVSGTTWALHQSTFIASHANHLNQLIAVTTAGGQSGRFDDMSIVPITQATLIRWRRIYYVSELSVDLRLTGGTNAGLIVGKNINNFVSVRLLGTALTPTILSLLKRVAGTYSLAVDSGAITYSAGAPVTLTPNPAFTEFSAGYNASEIISAAAINDFAADVDANGRFTVPYYAGLFNTFNSNNIDVDAFDNFSAGAVSS